ncbi:glycoside hydrolase family 6 protein [Streptomyces soliscabiei]|uniref:glycoside hydrolase family 6 protein n=1 Tax=Streptomyces soliscabiei TaxID=588897 RepID=UPI0029B110A1|nr:glycoside hydrolase family 6 protein [Streptomyces sp. NY05-11A]MDX2679715.1 glycoside hydrolase family 6 protein [Streptomyces sp. NY05-11A]
MYVRRGAVSLLGAVLLLTACSSGGDGKAGRPASGPVNPAPSESVSGPAVTQQPKEADPFWVNPDGSAARQAAVYEKAGEKDEAAAVREIAEQPTGQWLGPENPEQEARGFTEAADRVGRTPLLVLYNIPHRDCGQYSQGGASDGAAYRTWIAAVARGIADRPAIVVLEPDALLHLVDGCTPAAFHEERYDLLDDAVTALKVLKNTKVYLDAGNAGWGHPDQIHEPLRRAGLAHADGFAVNVSNFYSTEDSIEYGKQLSAKTGGKHFVVDTSRNGNGPYEEGDPAERWCNPPGRALGPTPTTRTADPLVDAYLWVKRPGESDGECKGGPKAGDWWAAYALRLARGDSGLGR